MFRRWVMVMLSAGVLVTGGCSEMDRSELRQLAYTEEMDVLVTRPSMEEVEPQFIQMQDEIRAAVTAVVPSLQWTQWRERNEDWCGEFGATRASHVRLPSWLAKEAIPEELWPVAVAAASEVASRYGFPEPSTLVDRPAHHDVNLVDSDGGRVEFATRINSVLVVHVGCYLRQEDKARYLAGETLPPTWGPRPTK